MGEHDDPFKSDSSKEENESVSNNNEEINLEDQNPFDQNSDIKKRILVWTLALLLLATGAYIFFEMTATDKLENEDLLTIGKSSLSKAPPTPPNVTTKLNNSAINTEKQIPDIAEQPEKNVVTKDVNSTDPNFGQVQNKTKEEQGDQEATQNLTANDSVETIEDTSSTQKIMQNEIKQQTRDQDFTPSPPRVKHSKKRKYLTYTPPTLLTPEGNATRNYDETANDAIFSWTGGPASWIKFSQNPNMNPLAFKVWIKGNHYKFHRPYPGKWYWQVSNKAGESEIRNFTINLPIERNLKLVSPASGESMSNDSLVKWIGDTNITYYKVEVSNRGWNNPNYKFSTSATKIKLSKIEAGSYNLRIGAFSEVSGRWEYSDIVPVSFQ